MTPRFLTLAGWLLLTGCGEFIPTGVVSTTNPSPEQVVRCRQVMYINPELEFRPVGYALETGLDDVIRFELVTPPGARRGGS